MGEVCREAVYSVVTGGGTEDFSVKRMRVGIVGCGNIATDLCRAMADPAFPAEVVALVDVEPARARALQDEFAPEAMACSLLEAAAHADFLVECAVAEAVAEILAVAVRNTQGCLILSLGALVTEPALLDTAYRSGLSVRLPSGAVCGLDGLRAAREAGIERVTLTTRKPPAGLEGAPYLTANGIDVTGLNEPLVVFEGNALEAVQAFPKNVNVAAAVSLAGIGPERTQVRVVADPAAAVNSHEIVAEGAFGRLVAVTENVPSPRNAKTSYLASLSAIAELRAAGAEFGLLSES
jgi:aspartate dehydrogenase